MFSFGRKKVPDPEPDEADEEPLCHCRMVYRSQIVYAVKELDAVTVEDLQETTTACTGCGCCRWDLEPLLEELKAGGAGSSASASSDSPDA